MARTIRITLVSPLDEDGTDLRSSGHVRIRFDLGDDLTPQGGGTVVRQETYYASTTETTPQIRARIEEIGRRFWQAHDRAAELDDFVGLVLPQPS